MSSSGPVILLAEDDPNDVFFFQRALKKAGFDCRLQIVTNGQETVDYLSGSGKFSDRTSPAFYFASGPENALSGWFRGNDLDAVATWTQGMCSSDTDVFW